jgi:hypothetical protein
MAKSSKQSHIGHSIYNIIFVDTMITLRNYSFDIINYLNKVIGVICYFISLLFQKE